MEAQNNDFELNKVTALGIDMALLNELGIAPGANMLYQAIGYFVLNSRFNILTYSSISCITLVATLDDSFRTPFVNIRQESFNQPVRRLLFKFFVTDNDNHNIRSQRDIRMDPRYRQAHEGLVEVTTRRGFREEIRKQIQIYNLSYLDTVSETNPIQCNPMSPLCPSILIAARYVEEVQCQVIRDRITTVRDMNKFVDFYTRGLAAGYNISYISMELMEGYITLGEYISRPMNTINRNNIVVKFLMYELDRLHKFGYIHGDIHYENALINPDLYYYCSREQAIRDASTNYQLRDNAQLGHIILLDFGRTTYIKDYPYINSAPNLEEKLRLCMRAEQEDFINVHLNQLNAVRDLLNTRRREISLARIQQLNATYPNVFETSIALLTDVYNKSIYPQLSQLGLSKLKSKLSKGSKKRKVKKLKTKTRTKKCIK